MFSTLIILLLLLAAPGGAEAVSSAPAASLVETYPKVCQHGIYHQPNNGPFAVMVFCDDAAGTHIGVVCYAPGSSCEEGPWTLDKRFWQEGGWADDVTAFAWDPSGACLYVSTDEIYGEGDLFILNLPARTSSILPPDLSGTLCDKCRYSTLLIGVDQPRGVLEYQVEYYDESVQATAKERKTLRLGRCGSE